MGRKKIEIAKIVDANARQIAVVVFSQAGKVFSFGSPHVDYVIDKHLHNIGEREGDPPNLADYVDSARLEGLTALEQSYNGINEQLISEKDKQSSLLEEGRLLGAGAGPYGTSDQGQQPNDEYCCSWLQGFDVDSISDSGGLQRALNQLNHDYEFLSRLLQEAQQNAIALQQQAQQNAIALQQQAQHQSYAFENPDPFQANYAQPNPEVLARVVPFPALQSGEENQASGSLNGPAGPLTNAGVGLLSANENYLPFDYSRGGAFNLQETNDGKQMSLPGPYNAAAASTGMTLREALATNIPLLPLAPYDGSAQHGFHFNP